MRILKIIEECRFGIHDISRQGLDERTELPRFNMPFELGLFIGCHHFSSPPQQESKHFLILDAEPLRYRQSLSDIAGYDIEIHDASAEKIIKLVRDWLANVLNRRLYGAQRIQEEFLEFERCLPGIAGDLAPESDQIGYTDLCHLMRDWIHDSFETTRHPAHPATFRAPHGRLD